ncbi:hypothetical protein HYC85_031359 [Camellia sinensis]|uniref:PARP1-like PADR1 domain-containing protein n=1 Tax=Camellia sinensis TaxID=4442 RepID=A0A7J7FTY7_CAMSI|nr:hypothetical protein HYC85_031359 [Camellia sinensis]
MAKPWKAEYAKPVRLSCNAKAARTTSTKRGSDSGSGLGRWFNPPNSTRFMPVLSVYTKSEGQGSKGLAWHHANCFMELSPTNLLGWESLPAFDQAAALALVKTVLSSTKGGTKVELQEDIESSNGGAKHKRAATGDQKSKIAKSDAVLIISIHYLFSADGMLFGALGRCPLCSGRLRYSGGMYRCHGYPSAWSKCSYSTTEPECVKGKWKIPEESSNDYLCKVKKSSRILPLPSSNVPRGGWKYLSLERTIWLIVSKDKKLPFDLYTIEAIREESSMVTVKVKGRSAVLESSGLQNSGPHP